MTTPILTYAPDLARRVGFIVVKLCLLLARDARKPHLIRIWWPLCRRLIRIGRRFTDLMNCLAGHPPHLRRGPHTGGAPQPENLLLNRLFGVRVPTLNGGLLFDLGWEGADVGWNLEAILAEPRAAEILAKVPAAARILWPLRNMLGLGPFDPCGRCYRPANPRPVQTRPRPSVPRRIPSPCPGEPCSARCAGRNSGPQSADAPLRPGKPAPRRRADPEPPVPPYARDWALPVWREPP